MVVWVSSEAAEKKEGHTWIKRPDRARLMRLRHLKVGESYEGMVITVNQYGCYVDFGAERDGYVRVRVSLSPVTYEINE